MHYQYQTFQHVPLKEHELIFKIFIKALTQYRVMSPNDVKGIKASGVCTGFAEIMETHIGRFFIIMYHFSLMLRFTCGSRFCE